MTSVSQRKLVTSGPTDYFLQEKPLLAAELSLYM